jgi:WD40 repeat protein
MGRAEVAFFETPQRIFGFAGAPKDQVIALTQYGRGWGELGMRVLDIGSGRELKRGNLPVPALEAPVRLSSDGKRLLTVNNNFTYRVWDVAQLKPTATIDPTVGDTRLCRSVQLSPDGKKLVGLTDVNGLEDVRVDIWDTTTGQLTHRFAMPGPTFHVGFTADGKQVVTEPFLKARGKTDRKLRLWDADATKIVKVIRLPLEHTMVAKSHTLNYATVQRIDPSPDGKWLAFLERVVSEARPSGDARPPRWDRWYVTVVDLITGAEKATWLVGQPREGGAECFPDRSLRLPPVAWSGDSRWLATGCSCYVVVCDVTTWTIKTGIKKDTTLTSALYWLENGHLLSGSDGGTISVWDPAKAP